MFLTPGKLSAPLHQYRTSAEELGIVVFMHTSILLDACESLEMLHGSPDPTRQFGRSLSRVETLETLWRPQTGWLLGICCGWRGVFEL